MRILVFLGIFATLDTTLGLKSDVSSTTTLQTSTTSTSTDPSTSPEPIIVTNICGGAVEVGAGETVIEYLPPGGYRDWEFCVWTLLPIAPYSGLSIDYVSYGLEYADGVVIYNWGQEGNVTKKLIYPNNANTTISFTKPYAAIAFSSDVSGSGQGFQVTIRGTGHLEGHFNYRGFVFNQTRAGNFSYPENFGLENYKPNERVAVVVQKKFNFLSSFVDIDFTDIEDDSLLVYSLDLYVKDGTAYFVGMTNGSNPEGVPSLTSLHCCPRLLLFHSNDNSKIGKGFSMSWKMQV